MATRLTALDSSLGIGQAGAVRLTQDILYYSNELGQLSALSQGIEGDLRQEGLSPRMVEKTIELADKINNMIKRVNECELALSSEPLSSVNGLARELLTAQVKSFKESTERLKGNSDYTIRDVKWRAREKSEKLFPIFEKAVGQYLQTRSYNDVNNARQINRNLGDLNRAVRELTFVQDQWSGRKVQVDDQEDPILERHYNLAKLIGCGYLCGDPCEAVLRRLDEVMTVEDENLDDRWGMNKERINQAIDKLHEEVGSDQVNYWVWELLGKKPGENYGQVHRYDDLGILKEAILRTTKSLADKIMKEEAVGLDQEDVLGKLYEIIGEPQVENPKAWMKGNVCYYTDQLHRAINEMKLPRRHIDDFNEGLSHRNMGSSLPPLSFDPSMSSFPVRSEPEKHKYTQIFEVLDEIGEGTVPFYLREQIEGMITELSDRGLADTINYEIWRLGGKKPGDNWGVVHRYDHADVLRQALMIAVRRDVHDQFVVKIFPDVEEQNAFYAAIANSVFDDAHVLKQALMMALRRDVSDQLVAKTFPDIEDQNGFYAAIGNCVFDDDEVPSSVDLVAYGKEKIVFHLHQLGRAEATVKRQIEERREQKAHESEEALGQIVEAAVRKNPAAKSIADMLRLIGPAIQIFAPTGTVEACKARIRETVESSDCAEDLRRQIFLGIWIKNDRPLGDSKYGDKHYLDNLEVLHEVLLNILVEIGINEEE